MLLEKELEKAKELLVIVEGKNDEASLEKLGFTSIFVLKKGGKSLGEKIEEIEKLAGEKKVCILSDFDKEGKKLYALLKEEFIRRGIKMDNHLRKVLMDEKISHIEGLDSFLENLDE